MMRLRRRGRTSGAPAVGRDIESRVIVEVTAKDVIIDSVEAAVVDAVVKVEVGAEAEAESELIPHCLCLCIRVLVLSAVEADIIEEASDALLFVAPTAARV